MSNTENATPEPDDGDAPTSRSSRRRRGLAIGSSLGARARRRHRLHGLAPGRAAGDGQVPLGHLHRAHGAAAHARIRAEGVPRRPHALGADLQDLRAPHRGGDRPRHRRSPTASPATSLIDPTTPADSRVGHDRRQPRAAPLRQQPARRPHPPGLPRVPRPPAGHVPRHQHRGPARASSIEGQSYPLTLIGTATVHRQDGSGHLAGHRLGRQRQAHRQGHHQRQALDVRHRPDHARRASCPPATTSRSR